MFKVNLEEQKKYKFFPIALMKNHSDKLYLGSRENIYHSHIKAYLEGSISLNNLDYLLHTILRQNYSSSLIIHSNNRDKQVHPVCSSYSNFDDLKNNLIKNKNNYYYYIKVKTEEEKSALLDLCKENVFIDVNKDFNYLSNSVVHIYAYESYKKSIWKDNGKNLFNANILNISYNNYDKDKFSVFSFDLMKNICYNYQIKELDLRCCSKEDALILCDIFEWHIREEHGFLMPIVLTNDEYIKSMFESVASMYKLACAI